MAGLTNKEILMHSRKLGRTRHWALTAGAAAVAGASLFGQQASAESVTGLCHTAGHPATSAEIIGRSANRLAAAQMPLSWLQVDYDEATTASPAAWRLREEIEQLRTAARGFGDLSATAFIRGDATPGSPAQFRAQEELDALCDSLG